MLNRFVFVGLGLALIASCNSGIEPESEVSDKQKPESKAPEEIAPEKVVEIEELFDSTAFSNPIMLDLLNEIQICQMDTATVKNPQAIPCSPEYFKFYPLSPSIQLENGFILLIKATAGGFPLRRVLVFQRERGELVKVNGFVANLIGRVKNESGYDDLLLRFRDLEGTQPVLYNCLFKWNGMQFEYRQVEEIIYPQANAGGKVKASLKDSISVEILENIKKNKMIF